MSQILRLWDWEKLRGLVLYVGYGTLKNPSSPPPYIWAVELEKILSFFLYIGCVMQIRTHEGQT